jgi:hypothetical protein
MSSKTHKRDTSDQSAERRDELLLRLLKTPPQPRPKRERGKMLPRKRKKGSGGQKGDGGGK